MKNVFSKFIKKSALVALRALPATNAFGIKRQLLTTIDGKIGENVRVVSSARFMTEGRVYIGNNSWIGHDFLLVGGKADVRIGKNCDIAPRVTIVFGSHHILIGEERAAGPGYSKPIDIGDGCWVGSGATILGGTIIGKCCVVAAGAVVRGEFPDRVLIGGVPARVIRVLENL